MSTSRKKPARARKKARGRKKPAPRRARRVVHPRTEASPWVVPIKSSSDPPPSNEPVFFTPQPKMERLTDHGLTKLKEHVANHDSSREVRAVIEEIEAIRGRELSVTEWYELRNLRDDLARRGVRRFIDIVDRVIEILEHER